MPHERYYLPQPFENGENILLQGPEHHHLAHVMRGRSGDQVELVNGEGQLAIAVIDTIEKRHSNVSIQKITSQTPPHYSLVLAQGIPRLNRLEDIIEKGTELGMTEIRLFPAARSEKKEFSENQIERLKSIAISAMKQCGRLFLPKIVLSPPIKQWDASQGYNCFFGDLRPTAPWFEDALAKDPSSSIMVCIGPESGFTDEETTLLERKGFLGITIHPNVLRTETAAIAALSLASHHLFKLK